MGHRQISLPSSTPPIVTILAVCPLTGSIPCGKSGSWGQRRLGSLLYMVRVKSPFSVAASMLSKDSGEATSDIEENASPRFQCKFKCQRHRGDCVSAFPING